jgi:CBS domain containing-hemolysin-like protein
VSLLTGFELDSPHANSIGGLLTSIEGDIPVTGKLFNVGGGTLRVMQADPKGVKLVRLTLKNVKTGLTAP